MTQADKHRFENLSMLTVDKGQLDVTFIPISHHPDWILPSQLILYVERCEEYIDYLNWEDRQIPTLSLLETEQKPNKIVILEGDRVEHRLALLINGELKQRQIKFSDAKDIEYYEDFKIETSLPDFNRLKRNADDELDSNRPSFIFQMIEIDGKVYGVPDIEVLTKRFKTL